jgi:hypothetical protein
MMALLVVLSGVSGITTIGGGSEADVTESVALDFSQDGNEAAVGGAAFEKVQRVVVVTTDVAALATYLAPYDYEGLIGTRPSAAGGISFPILTVPKALVSGLEAQPFVLGVYPYADGVESDAKSAPRLGEAASAHQSEMGQVDLDTIMRYFGPSYYQGAEAAWDLGYTGSGVNVGVITGGVDFAHPDLVGRHAVSSDPSYLGMPIAFDGSSLSTYLADGLPGAWETPDGSTWFVNTSSTDTRILHTAVVDGSNDYWAETDIHGTSGQVYDVNDTTELRGRDSVGDKDQLEFDLGNSYVAQDAVNYYIGFEVAESAELSPRVLNVRYGIYIDTGAGIGTAGATTDPLGNLVSTDATHRPEFAIYMTHYGQYWGFGSDGVAWSKNDTIPEKEVAVYGWGGTSWNYQSALTDKVNATGFKGAFSMKSGFVEMALPKASLNNAAKFSMAIMSFGTNASRPQDAIPKEFPVVFGSTVNWGTAPVTLTNYTLVDLPKSYVTAGTLSVAGGKPRIGLHPDQNLIAYHYGRPAALLVTESQTVGVYDTIYVDLDNDKSFADERPMQNYGAYNESIQIGPQWGTVRDGTSRIKVNSTWYDLKKYETSTIWSNETMTLSAAGGENTFHLGNGSVNVASITIDRPASHIHVFANGTVDGAGTEWAVYNITDAEVTPWSFSLPHGNLVNYTLLAFIEGDTHYDILNDTLFPGAPTTVNPLTGLVTLNEASIWDNPYSNNAIVEIDAWYNFSVPVDMGFTFNAGTGNVVLDEPLAAGDYLTIKYTYTDTIAQPIHDAERSGQIFYNGQYRTIELRDWWGGKDMDSEGAKADGKSYPDLSAGMAYFIAKAEAVFNETPTLTSNGSYVVLANTNIVNNSWSVRVNGTAYDLSKVKVDLATGHMDFTPAIWPTAAVSVDYDYDGLAIPYSAKYSDRHAINNVIPGNGDLIALTGSFDLDYSQGTEIATAILGGNVSVDGNGISLLQGMAPDAKLISIRADAFSAWFFSVEGYDGNVTTTADQAQVVALTSSYGSGNDGFDVYSRGIDYISTVYAEGRTVFVSGTGDSGHGYGSINSPASSPGVISVGQGTNFAYRNYKPKAPALLARTYADGGPNANAGQILPSSSRGPSLLGCPEPDVIATGAFLFVGTPLNGDQDATSPMDLQWEGGQWAWDLASGSWGAGSVATGAVALIMQSYKQAHAGQFPTADMVRRIITSSADNLNYDPLSQGAGMVNALRGVMMASSSDGILINKTFWTPGEYRGVDYDAFVHLMKPGQSATTSVAMTNVNPTTASQVKVYDAVLMKFDSLELQLNITKNYDDDNVPCLLNVEPYIPLGTELLRATFTSAAPVGNMQTYMAEFFDWTDLNGNGKLDFTSEQNRVTYSIGSNSMELRLRDPLGTFHDGIGMQIKSFGGDGEALNDWTVHLEFYTQVDWGWLTLSGAPATINGGATDDYEMALAIPSDAALGSYEGGIYSIEKAPMESNVVTGVGIMVIGDHFGDPVGSWDFYPPPGSSQYSEATAQNATLRAGNFLLVEGSSTIHWNGSLLNEGTDYIIGASGDAKFITAVPEGALAFMTIDYLAVEATAGVANYEASWFGTLAEGNLKKGNYTFYKDGVEWDANKHVSENVMIAVGGERKANLEHGELTRSSWTLFFDGAELPQAGGSVTGEEVVASAAGGELFANLSRGAVVKGSSTVYKNSVAMPQTASVSVYDRESVAGLNAAVTTVTAEVLTLGAPNTGGCVWNDTGTWYGLVDVNTYDNPNYKLISYTLFADGVALTDGSDVQMNIMDGPSTIYGKFQILSGWLEPGTVTYTVDYRYYDMTLKTGYLEHRNVVPESAKLYLSGREMKTTEYQLDLETGHLILSVELNAGEFIEAVYSYITYTFDRLYGMIEFSDALSPGDSIVVDYEYENYTVDLVRGVLYFSESLAAGVNVTINYSYVQYTVDSVNGVIKFNRPLLPGEVVSCEYWHYVNVMPVLVNIGADGPNFAFGGGAETGLLYGPNEVTGGYGSGDGDRRMVYFDIPEQGYQIASNPNYKLFTELTWTNNLTDVNVQVYGGRSILPSIPLMGGDTFQSDRYGPHGLSMLGTSDATANFFTTTNGPGETIALPYSPGLNVLALNTVRLSGAGPTELYEGSVGSMYIDQPTVSVETNQLIGSTSLYMHSSAPWKGIGGFASGPSAPKQYKNMTVHQDDANWANYATFEEQLSSGSTSVPVELKDCLIFQVHLMGHVDFGYKDVTDLDLGIFLDGSNDQPKDGKTQVEEFVAMDADGDADETVKLIKPLDGTYLIRPFGFTLKTDPAHFDLDITIVQGKGFAVSGAKTTTIAPFTTTEIALSWVLPGDTMEGKLLGAMYMGPEAAQMCLLVPIEIEYDVTEPAVSGSSPPDGTYTNDPTPTISAAFLDSDRGKIVPRTLDIKIDGVSMRTLSSIAAVYERKNDAVDTMGFWSGAISHTPAAELLDGAHHIQATVSDEAGNVRVVDWVITVDRQAPELAIDTPASNMHVREGPVEFSGMTTPGSELSVHVGAENIIPTVSQDGRFSFTVANLVEGLNEVMVSASDVTGNAAVVTRDIYLDLTTPGFEYISSSTLSLTRQSSTTLSGKVDKVGTIEINGNAVPMMADGTFETEMPLAEGSNTFEATFTDMAGNSVSSWKNITRDTTAPVILLDAVATTTHDSAFTVRGDVDDGADVAINGKPVTADAEGAFTKVVNLSYGVNTIVVTGKDNAGNVAETRLSVNYEPEVGTNWAAIGLMIGLLAVGLIVGIILMRMIGGGKGEPKPEVHEAEAEVPKEAVEGEVKEGVAKEEGLDVPAEEPEGKEHGAEEIPEVAKDESAPTDLPPIPAEESLPEELPPVAGEAPAAEPEAVETPKDAAPAVKSEEKPDAEPEAAPSEPEADIDPLKAEKMEKLKKALEDGKISKELYEKNLARIKSQ